MPKVFETPKGSIHATYINGVGQLQPGGANSIPAEAAAAAMHELQDDSGRPLKGKALAAAAERYAKANGLAVREVSQDEIDAIGYGTAPPAGRPPLHEVGAAPDQGVWSETTAEQMTGVQQQAEVIFTEAELANAPTTVKASDLPEEAEVVDTPADAEAAQLGGGK